MGILIKKIKLWNKREGFQQSVEIYFNQDMVATTAQEGFFSQ